MRKSVQMALAAIAVFTTGTEAIAQSRAIAVPYATANRGGASIQTIGDTDSPVVGYGRVQPTASTTPSGVAILQLRRNGVFVSETGVPGAPTMIAGRTYAELNGSTNTAVAFVNPGSLPVAISFSFTDQGGNDFGQGSFTMDGNTQLARFLNEVPFRGRANFVGTFTFSASAPVAAIALRTLLNERSEFLVTTQTITSIPDNASGGPLILAHFADGAGWKTRVFLVNTTDVTITGTAQFYGEGSAAAAATPLTLAVNGQVSSSFNYSIRGRSSANLETAGPLSAAAQIGSVKISPAGGSSTPAAFVVFSLSNSGVTVAQATVQAEPLGNTFRTYVEMNTRAALVGAIQSGFAIANNSLTPGTVNFELSTLDGTSSGLAASVVVPAFGHVSKFVHELFPTLGLPSNELLEEPFRGILRISSSNSVAVLSLRTRYNERGEFLITTTPATNEGSPSSSAELLFPHIVDGGGYATQFALFSGISGQATTGTLRFFGQDGQALNLTIP